jgi:putative endonuclease
MLPWRPHRLGRDGEAVAERYLRRLGYRVLDVRCRTRLGELDLIALDGRTIVFVEVKTRSSVASGAPFEAVDRDKQQRLTRTALEWLKRRRLLGQSVRFDVVGIVWNGPQGEPELRHFRHAFEAVGRGQFFA